MPTLEEKLERLDSYGLPSTMVRDPRLSVPVQLTVGNGYSTDDICVRAGTRDRAVDIALDQLEARDGRQAQMSFSKEKEPCLSEANPD